MDNPQTYDNCRYFTNNNRCPYVKNKLMIQFIRNTKLINGMLTKTMDFSKAETINNKFCNGGMHLTPAVKS
jgi:hypothetical protein